jgi:hypothetical protein
MAIEKPHLADAAAALLIGRKQPEWQAFADDIVLGLLLLGRQLVAFPVLVGGRTLLRLLKLALLHELEEAASLSIRPRRAAALLCSSGHRALLRYANLGNDHGSASFRMEMAGLLNEPMRRIRITQATKPSYPPVILRFSKELWRFRRGELKRRCGLACHKEHETVAVCLVPEADWRGATVTSPPPVIYLISTSMKANSPSFGLMTSCSTPALRK